MSKYQRVPLRHLECENCNKKFSTHRPNQKCCSPKCNRTKWLATYRASGLGTQGDTSISTGTKGAIGELRVSADLLSRKWDVFRAVSQACSCDIVAVRQSLIIKVEVRTGTKHKRGIGYSKRNIKADTVAIVLHDRIVYDPPIPA